MELCILCRNPIPEKTKPEHVLMNALGGRMTVSKIICPDCNHEMGIGPDQDLADSVAVLRNSANLKAGDGDDAPWIKGITSGEHHFDLSPGTQPVMKPKKPLTVKSDADGIKVTIDAYGDAQANRLATAAATKIAKSYGHNDKTIIEAIKAEISKDKVSTLQPSPLIHQQLQLGTGRSQQSMAKSALVLWAKLIGIDEVLADRYNQIRNYIKDGEEENTGIALTKLDSRPLPMKNHKYGSNPNIVWAGSDANGQVFGYFRIYGAMGWRINLCNAEAPANRSICLISNPFDNTVWDRLEDQDNPIQFSWIKAEWESYPPDFESVNESLSAFMRQAQETSQNLMVVSLIKEALEKAGLQEGDMITEDIVPFLSKYVGRRLTVGLLRKPLPLKESE